MGWKQRAWQGKEAERQQGSKRPSRSHETGPDHRWGEEYTVKSWVENPAVERPESDCPQGEGAAAVGAPPSSSCSGVTSLSQAIEQTEEVVTGAESKEQIRAKLDAVRNATKGYDARDHVWKTLKREEMRLVEMLNRKQQAAHDAAEQAVVLQREYHRHSQRAMASWEKRQRLTGESRKIMRQLEEAEKEYTCNTVTKDLVGAKLQQVVHEAHQARLAAEQRAAQPLNVLEELGVPAGSSTIPMGAVQQEPTPIQRAIYPRSMRPKAVPPMGKEPARYPVAPLAPKQPVLPMGTANPWMQIQQVARGLEAAMSLDPSSPEAIRAEVEEAVRLAQRAREHLNSAEAKAAARRMAELADAAQMPPPPSSQAMADVGGAGAGVIDVDALAHSRDEGAPEVEMAAAGHDETAGSDTARGSDGR